MKILTPCANLVGVQNLKKYFQLVKLLFLPYFVLLVVANHLDQMFNENIEAKLRSIDGADYTLWIFAGFSLLLSLIIPWIIQALGLQIYIRSENANESFYKIKTNLNLIAIESLRAWGKMVVYSLFFILPGLWKYLQYQFIPWIVCFSKSYSRGEVDALKASESFFKKAWGRVMALSLFFLVILPLALSLGFDQNQFFWANPLFSVLYHALEALIHILFIQIMTNLFLALVREENHESIL